MSTHERYEMSQTKKWLPVVSVATAGVLLLGACGGDGGEDGDGAAVQEGPITIMAALLSAQAPDPDGTLQTAIEEYTGHELDVTWVPNSNYNDRMNVTLASDDIPQVMLVQGKTPAFIQSAEAGAFWDLTPYLEEYPNLTPESEEVRLAASVNGTSYGIYRMRDPMRAAVTLRGDWMTNLGLELPESVEDLEEVMRAFTQDDPDGNGADDTYGMIIAQWPGGTGTHSPYDVVETWFGAPNRWGEENGELAPAFESEAFLEANRWMRSMIEQGFVNADFATMDSATWNDPFFNGQGGIIIDMSSRAGQLQGLFKEQYPDNYGDYVAMTGNLEGPDGELNAYPTAGFSGFLAVPRSSVPTEEDLRRILEFLNDLSAEEGQILLNNGIEGVNFEVDGDYAVPIDTENPEVATITNDVAGFAQIGTSSNGYLAHTVLPPGEPERELFELRLEVHDADLEHAVYDPAAALVSQTYITQGATLDLIVADARIRYLAGQLDEAGLVAEVERWRSDGGEAIVQEVNALYDELG